MLDLKEIKEAFDGDYEHNQTTRIKAADDLFFARVSQWDSSLLNESTLAYKGEFNIVRKATRHILADLRANPVSIDFEPKAESRADGAELLDGLYLSDDRTNTTMEAYENAMQEAVDCGIGGWERYTEYESRRDGERRQVIRARPIYEFNNNAFPDSNAKLADKSDALRWTLLEAYSRDGYRRAHQELTGEDTDPENFAFPEQSYVFPWVTNDLFYIARHYHRTKVKDKVLTLLDPLGQPLKLLESSLTEIMDELVEQGYEIAGEKKIERWQVRLYICSGEKIMKSYIIPGEHIPVIPVYGERAFVEGEECYEGAIRLAKDPQRLRNFMLSYLGDTVSRSPRKKPIFGAEQIAGFEFMYEQNGADNNLPYLLQHLKDANSNQLPAGPLAYLEEPQVGQAAGALIELTRQAVEDVANPGLPKEYGDKDVSGKAIELMQARFDQQSVIYQQNMKHAKRYDATVFASMATEVYDTPRKVTITLPDGTRKTEEIMQTVLDEETGELKTLNDLTNMEFEVYAKVGPSYSSMREKTMENLERMAEAVKDTDPVLHKALVYKMLQLMDGVNVDDIREYTNKQLILMGMREPETPEEEAFLQQASQQPKEPDANTLLAQGEYMKGQAAVMKEQREAQNDQVDHAIDARKVQIDAFNAETKREDTRVRAAEVGLNMRLTQAKITGQHLDNMGKALQPRNPRQQFGARVNA